ncbi:MAG: glycosyltransferase family 2 protein, partial [Ferruginibacter sp.]|nr:glycosyltransferase family 2 protein [Cytophagales bacterium]
MPKVSVIVPNYNHAKYLAQRIESVLNQTYSDFELILMDDCSTDDSLAALNQYRLHPKVSKLLVNQINSGSPFSQWNRGVQAAVGEYIWIAESDDYAGPQFLEKLLPVLEHHPRVGLVYCQSWCVDEAGCVTGDLDWWTQSLDPSRWKRDFTCQGQQEVSKYLFYKNTIPNASAVVFRKSVFDQAGGALPELKMCGD